MCGFLFDTHHLSAKSQLDKAAAEPRETLSLSPSFNYNVETDR